MTEYITRRTLLNKSKVEWTDYNCNHYVGCAHNCQYPCYARKISRKSQAQWMDTKIVKNALELAVKEIRHVPSGSRIMVSSMSDPYQPIEQIHLLTRSLIPILAGFKAKPVMPPCRPQDCFGYARVIIITKSDLVRRDFDLIRQFPNVTLCMTITSTDDLPEWEPFAPGNTRRIECLQDAKSVGIRTIASIEPWIPNVCNIGELVERLLPFVDEFFIGSWNHHFKRDSIDGLCLKAQYRTRLPPVLDLLRDHMKKVTIKEELLRQLQQHLQTRIKRMQRCPK